MQINSKLNSKPYDYLYKFGHKFCTRRNRCLPVVHKNFMRESGNIILTLPKHYYGCGGFLCATKAKVWRYKRLHSHLSFFHYLLLLETYYYEIHILQPSITSTEHKGPNPNMTALHVAFEGCCEKRRGLCTFVS